MLVRYLNQFGLSLPELLVTLSIAAIVLVSSLPSLQVLSQKQRMDAATYSLIAQVNMARNAAITQGRRITLAARNTPSGSHWNSGWIIFSDINRNAQADTGEPVIAEANGLQNITLSGNGAMTQYMSFNSLGQPIQSNGAFLSGTWLLCTPSKTARTLVMSKTGRLRVDTSPTQTCL